MYNTYTTQDLYVSVLTCSQAQQLFWRYWQHQSVLHPPASWTALTKTSLFHGEESNQPQVAISLMKYIQKEHDN